MCQPPPPCSASNLQQRSAEPSNNKQIGNRLFYNDTKDQALHHFALLMEGTWRHLADQQKQGKQGKQGKQDTCDPKTSRDVSLSYRSYRIPYLPNFDVPRQLLTAGADAMACAASGATAVSLAARNQDKAMLRYQAEARTIAAEVMQCFVDRYISYDYRWHLVSKDIYLGDSAEILILWFTWFAMSVKEHPAETFWRAEVEEPGRIH